MRARHLDAKWFVGGGVGVILAGAVLWPVVAGKAHGGLSLPPRSTTILLNGIVAGLLVTALALSAVRRPPKAGEGTETKFRSLLEAAPDAIVLTRQDGK